MKAFPYQHKNPTSGLTTESEGMTLRDYFAAKYMQAVCSAIMTQSKVAQTSEEDMFRLLQSICATAYLTADLMVEEREVKHDNN